MIQQLVILYFHRPFWIIVLIGSFVLSLWETLAVLKLKIHLPSLRDLPRKMKYIRHVELNHYLWQFMTKMWEQPTWPSGWRYSAGLVVPIQWAPVQIHVEYVEKHHNIIIPITQNILKKKE